MAGTNQANRTAQQQFEALNADAKKTLRDAYTATPEEIDWDSDTVYSKRKNQKTIRVSFDTKLKRYTTTESSSIVPEEEAIKVHLGDTYIHYRYHSEMETHVHIPDPPRSEFSTKYVTMAQNCHLIKGRDITVNALLAYAVQKASTNAAFLRNAIRSAPSEELVSQRSTDHSAYTELVKAILDRIECVTNREDLNLNVDQEVDEINALIGIMREKKHTAKM